MAAAHALLVSAVQLAGNSADDPPRGGARQRHDPRLGRLVGRGRRADAGGEGARRHSIAAAAATTQVITPRRTRLVRVPDLHAFRAMRSQRSCQVQTATTPKLRRRRPDARGGCAFCARALGDVATAETLIVTRDELYDLLHARLPNPPRRLIRARARRDRAGAGARRRGGRGAVVSAPARPRRRDAALLRSSAPPVAAGRAVRGADREALGSDDVDRATARMRTQTRFLARGVSRVRAAGARLRRRATSTCCANG